MLEACDSLPYVFFYEMHNIFVYAVLTQEQISSLVFSEYDSIYFKFPIHNSVLNTRIVGVILPVIRGFPQPQRKFRNRITITPRLHPSKPFVIHHSLSILPSDATKS
jgi:hypothetical protein